MGVDGDPGQQRAEAGSRVAEAEGEVVVVRDDQHRSGHEAAESVQAVGHRAELQVDGGIVLLGGVQLAAGKPEDVVGVGGGVDGVGARGKLVEASSQADGARIGAKHREKGRIGVGEGEVPEEAAQGIVKPLLLPGPPCEPLARHRVPDDRGRPMIERYESGKIIQRPHE